MSDRLPQKVEIVEPRGSEWAKESTLGSLTAAVGVSNKLLKAIGNDKTKNISLTDLDRFQTKIRGANEGLEGIEQSTRDLKGTLLGVTRSLYGNSREIARTTANLASSADSTSGFMRTLGQAGGQLTGAMGRMGPVGAVAAAGMTAVSAATMLMVDRVLASRDAFMNMTQAGLYFSGNSLEFAARVRESGLELQQFTSIAEKYNVALMTSAGAESGYLRQVRELGGTFDRLNISIQDGAEYFAEFLDQSRLSNALYMQDERAQREAFVKNAEIQQELARITGVSVRQQREQARAAAASRQMQALMASRPEDAARLQRAAQNVMTATGLNQQQIDELALFATTGRPLSGDLQKMGSFDPQMFARLIEELRSGGTDDSARRLLEGQRATAEAFQGSDRSRFVAEMMQSTGMSGAVGVYQDIMTRGRQIDTTRPGAAGGPPGRPIDAQTQQLNETVSNVQRLVGALDATVIRAGAAALETFKDQISALNGVLNSINTENIMSVFTGLRDTLTTLSNVLGPLGSAISGISGAVGSITGLSGGQQLGGLLAGYAGYRVLRGGAGIMRGLSGAAGAGAAGAGAAGAGARAVSPWLRRIPYVGGAIAGGIEGVTTGDWMRGAVVGAGSLAGGIAGGAGGSIVGPAGTVAGAVGGSMIGENIARGIYEWFSGTPQTAATAEPSRPETQNFFNDVIVLIDTGFTTLNTTLQSINEKFREDGAIVRQLNSIASNTNDTRNILSDRM